MLVIVPHQDDEIFCYSFLKKDNKLIIVFKGGGEPKGHILEPEELYKRRCDETLKTCKEMGIKDISFLGVERPYTTEDLNKAVQKVFENSRFGTVVTTMTTENHPDHVALGKSVIKYCNADKLYGFIVHTGTLVKYAKKVSPDKMYELSKKELTHKIKLADNYETQKHFLPNIIRRPQYKIEKYWRLK